MIRKVVDDLWAGQPKSHHSKHTDWNAKSCSVLLDGAASYLVVTETLAAVRVEPLLDAPDGGPVNIPLQLVGALLTHIRSERGKVQKGLSRLVYTGLLGGYGKRLP